MSVGTKKLYTLKDIYNLPDGERAELIDGIIYMMSPPKAAHQRIVSKLHGEIYEYIKRNKGECEIFPAPFAVFLNADDKTYVEPDISIICDKSKITEDGCNGAPDWIIEVVSQSSRRIDKLIKLLKYRSSGVKEYWIVDPILKAVTVYNFETDDIYEYTFYDKIKSILFKNFEFDFSIIKE